MRRIIAVLSLLTFANLVFVLDGSACPLAGTVHGIASAGDAGAEGHAGHHMDSTDQSATELSDGGEESPATCLTTGPCALTLDFVTSEAPVPGTVAASRVAAVSEHLPPSAATAPELPPPRA